MCCCSELNFETSDSSRESNAVYIKNSYQLCTICCTSRRHSQVAHLRGARELRVDREGRRPVARAVHVVRAQGLVLERGERLRATRRRPRRRHRLLLLSASAEREADAELLAANVQVRAEPLSLRGRRGSWRGSTCIASRARVRTCFLGSGSVRFG